MLILVGILRSPRLLRRRVPLLPLGFIVRALELALMWMLLDETAGELDSLPSAAARSCDAIAWVPRPRESDWPALGEVGALESSVIPRADPIDEVEGFVEIDAECCRCSC